ncbi:MAG: hypothetical protein ACXWXN_05730 [Actinomycetota bacterium]
MLPEEHRLLCFWAQPHLAGDVFHIITNPSVLGFLELSLGDHERAERWLSPLPELLTSRGIVEPGIYPFAPDLVEALVGMGDLDRPGRCSRRSSTIPRSSTACRRSPRLRGAAG